MDELKCKAEAQGAAGVTGVKAERRGRNASWDAGAGAWVVGVVRVRRTGAGGSGQLG